MSIKVIRIRRGSSADAARISRLATETALRFLVTDCTREGAATLVDLLRRREIARRLDSDEFRFVVAEDGDELVGAAALQGDSHVFLLMVAPERQRAGLGRKLWELLRDESLPVETSQTFTVHASRYSVAALMHLGFSTDGGFSTSDNGIGYQPMSISVSLPARVDTENPSVQTTGELSASAAVNRRSAIGYPQSSTRPS